jgi:hypothetical protein
LGEREGMIWQEGRRLMDYTMAIATQGADHQFRCGRVFVSNNNALPLESVRWWGTHVEPWPRESAGSGRAGGKR